MQYIHICKIKSNDTVCTDFILKNKSIGRISKMFHLLLLKNLFSKLKRSRFISMYVQTFEVFRMFYQHEMIFNDKERYNPKARTDLFV